MQAGDVGITLAVPSTLDLQTTDSVTLTVIGPEGVKTSLPMIVGSTPLLDNNGNTVAAAYYWAYRLTLSTDFPNAFNYLVQLIADFSSGAQNEASQEFNILVGPRL